MTKIFVLLMVFCALMSATAIVATLDPANPPAGSTLINGAENGFLMGIDFYNPGGAAIRLDSLTFGIGNGVSLGEVTLWSGSTQVGTPVAGVGLGTLYVTFNQVNRVVPSTSTSELNLRADINSLKWGSTDSLTPFFGWGTGVDLVTGEAFNFSANLFGNSIKVVDLAEVPEPSTLTFLGFGFATLWVTRHRFRK